MAVEADPRAWIAQEVVALSTGPTSVGNRLAPRHLDLRPFAVNDGRQLWVVPGGLTRVALPEGGLVVNSSQGGGSKDTWVTLDDRSSALTQTPARAGRRASTRPPVVARSRPAAGRQPEPGPGLGDGTRSSSNNSSNSSEQPQRRTATGPSGRRTAGPGQQGQSC